ncbi:unnamed protein product [Orchesella dallaii]|uniref:Odorant receptor n=1 Tax=Orchesella dallaii TaxID=48710 RepID=A0ABP1QA26_9HEXA
MATITDYQRLMWQFFSYVTVCRFYVVRENGNFVIKKAGRIRQFIYHGIWINTLTKVTYLILAYRKLVPVEVHFLDQMGMWDWFLCFSQIIQEVHIWYGKYPLFEVLCANWKIQEQVFEKLGSPKHVETAILKNDRSLFRMHIFMVLQGVFAIVIQFNIAPKYAAQIYAIVPYDNWFLRIVFVLHEIMYVYHIWVHQVCSIMLCEVFAFSYTQIIREMTVVFQQLIHLGVKQQNLKKENKSESASETFMQQFIVKRRLEPDTKVPGTEYDIMTLLHDYQNMMLATTTFNKSVGVIMGGTMGSNYAQFVSDVFMMIQLLKEEETDMLAVIFYAGDACAGMAILFRMLIILSQLYPSSEEFLHVLKQYLTFQTPIKRYLLKYQRGFRIISANLGGYKTKAITVPKGINALMQWYINAAMWQRPADRMT